MTQHCINEVMCGMFVLTGRDLMVLLHSTMVYMSALFAIIPLFSDVLIGSSSLI